MNLLRGGAHGRSRCARARAGGADLRDGNGRSRDHRAVLPSGVRTGEPAAGQGYELFAIAAAAIGGTSLAGGKGSILVPLPTAAADHQTYNARALADAGAAVLLPERDLTPEVLAGAVMGLLADRARLESLGAHARDRGHPDAAREIASTIVTLGS